jgi:tRNA-uridine 2-sulfurtransferase
MKRVLVGLSGGIYSLVTSALLKSQGYDVMGLHLRMGSPSSFDSRCVRDALEPEGLVKSCEKLGLTVHVLDVAADFEDKVTDYVVHEYLQLRKPNPCIPCNRDIKFKYLFREAQRLGCQWVATGHGIQVIYDPSMKYARVERAVEDERDQSYFLFNLNQDELKMLLTPLGALPDALVRKLASEFGITDRPERIGRREVCFSGRPGYVEFIESRSAPVLRPKGVVRTTDGRVSGEHFGLHRYSIGQKEGDHSVAALDPGHGVVILGSEADLKTTHVIAERVTWLRPVDQLHGIRAIARLSPDGAEIPCRVVQFENATARVIFDLPQRAVAPGQAIVFYDANELLGGGIIQKGTQAQYVARAEG